MNTGILTTLSLPGGSEMSDLTPTWTDEQTKIRQIGQILTPPSSDFDYSPSRGQISGEGNLQMQLTPLYLEENLPPLFDQRRDYFSLGMGQVLVNNEFQFHADHASIPKQILFSNVELAQPDNGI